MWVKLSLALPLSLASGLLALVGYVYFRRHDTPVDPAKPTTGIITSGPFRISRNPMYLALLLLFGAVFCLRPGWWLAGFCAVFYGVMSWG